MSRARTNHSSLPVLGQPLETPPTVSREMPGFAPVAESAQWWMLNGAVLGTGPRSDRATQVLVVHADPLLALGAFTALMHQPHVRVLLHGSEAYAASQSDIDVVVADGTRGIEFVQAPKADRPARLRDAKVLVIETAAREQSVRKAIEAGVLGFSLSSAGPLDLCDGVLAVSRGARHLSPALAACLADSLIRDDLSERESDVLALLAGGLCNKTIARQLGIAVGTVKLHIKAIMSKLDATSRTHALSIAVARGLVGP